MEDEEPEFSTFSIEVCLIENKELFLQINRPNWFKTDTNDSKQTNALKQTNDSKQTKLIQNRYKWFKTDKIDSIKGTFESKSANLNQNRQMILFSKYVVMLVEIFLVSKIKLPVSRKLEATLKPIAITH